MQRTRLNLLFDATFNRLTRFFQNPWRKIALITIFLLLGNFLATVFPPAVGQTTNWDPIVAAAITFIFEVVSLIYYKYGDRQQSLLEPVPPPASPRTQFVLELLNVFKIGMLYGLIVSAINVGS